MKINVKLYGLLRINHEGYDYEQGITVILPEEASLADLMSKFHFDDTEVAMIIVNGRLTKQRDLILKEGYIVEISSHIPYGG